MAQILSSNFYAQAEELFKKYPKRVHALLPLLHKVQAELGCINPQAMKEVADLVEKPITHVQGVVTFYTMFNQKKRGEHYVGVCTNIACWLKGAEELFESLEKYFKLPENQNPTHTGEGQKFFLEEVECLGACGYAPVILADNQYIQEANLEKIKNWTKEKEKLSLEKKQKV